MAVNGRNMEIKNWVDTASLQFLRAQLLGIKYIDYIARTVWNSQCLQCEERL